MVRGEEWARSHGEATARPRRFGKRGRCEDGFQCPDHRGGTRARGDGPGALKTTVKHGHLCHFFYPASLRLLSWPYSALLACSVCWQTLLQGGADVNAANQKGNSALCVAASAEVARILLEVGADPTKINHVVGEARNPLAVERAYVRNQQPRGGPPRGTAKAQRNWQPALQRKLVRAPATPAAAYHFLCACCQRQCEWCQSLGLSANYWRY